jgi:uncharacterized membrane protein SpoIIM required for sporulation
MISSRWLEKRKPYWNRLEELLRQSHGGMRTLSRGELREMGLLYRQIAADLSAVRQDRASRNIAEALNQLLARAHTALYFGRSSRLTSIFAWFAQEYPRVFRRTLSWTLAAALLFLAFGIAGMLVTLIDPRLPLRLLGPGMVATIQQHKMWTESVVSMKPLASSEILTNNLTVSLSTFAMGITAGIGTVYLLAFNGLLMGVVGTACWQNRMILSLWSFVAPHGVLEIPAIFIAGGAGLLLARGLLFPGWLPRREALRRSAGEAGRLMLGIFPLLIVAGMTEGFFSPTHVHPWLKFIWATVMFSAMVAWLTLGGRHRQMGNV